MSTGSTYVLSRSESIVENSVTGSVNLFSLERAGRKRDDIVTTTPAVKEMRGIFRVSKKASSFLKASDWNRGVFDTLVLTLSSCGVRARWRSETDGGGSGLIRRASPSASARAC